MVKKTSKYHIFSGALLVLSLLLISCQSMIAFAEENKQASDLPGELRVDDPPETEMVVDNSSPGIKISRTWLEGKIFLTVYTVKSDGPAWVVFCADEDGIPGAILEYVWVGSGTNSISRTEVLEEMSSKQIHVMLHHDLARIAVFEFPGPDGRVLVENEMALKTDDPPETKVVVNAYLPGIEMRRTWLESRSFLTVYTVRSDRPAWVVFRADEDGLPGAILHYSFVGSGIHTIARVEDAATIRSEKIHVMLHEDFGRLSVFEFPGPDGPLYVDNKIVDLLCCGPY